MSSVLSIHVPRPADDSDSPHSPHSPETSAAGKPPRELAPFLRQLREMLERESPAILRWTPDGRAFEILDLHAMTHVVLPKYFKHAKYASFQRQLNYFSFRKWTKSKSPRCTFANPHFVREAPELTWRITRKRDASTRKRQLHLKRQRAQSFDPQGSSQVSASSSSTASTSSSLLRDRAASESSLSVGGAARRPGEPDDDSDPGGGLLEWIDDQFPSIASLALLDDGEPPAPPVWTPYAPCMMLPSSSM